MANKISAFLRGVREEMKRVSWPSRPRIIRSTLVVLITIVIFAVLIGSMDFMFFQIIKFFLK
ncbi:preprotein translocase subunit SecE [Candidatus Aerophobetes bacterium]|uniref:Protein translocase subunit SecE n=1 Tax=Aerophobetes bacterium TaxID=2030807 RepID=A0A523RR68_UNCAE|nr:MAG: preprotein translocase subunit SecE [Candidatus Aerophobetes bacterium]